MDLIQIELDLIEYLVDNIKKSGEVVPTITRDTAPLSDILGFDSLRTLEILIELEEKFGCDLPAEKFFDIPHPERQSIADMAKTIKTLVEA